MTRNKRGRHLKNWNSNQAQAPQGKLRIIGGTFRGRVIDYSGDPVTRPMKDNVREALFNFCLLYTSPSPRDRTRSRMPSSA